MTGDHPVVFLHVMKCGGSSVRSGLATSITGQRDGPAVFELDGRVARSAAGGSATDDWRFRDALLPYVVAAVRPSVIMGHFRYRDAHSALAERTHLLTVLRDPVDRFVSLYFYRRHRQGVDLPVSVSLSEQIDSQRWAAEGHRYVDTFCGRDDLDPRSEEAITAAVTNLRRFTVGSTEHLSDFGAAVTDRIDVPVTFPILNTRPIAGPGTTPHIDPGVLDRLREMCAPDRRVYNEAIGRSGMHEAARNG